MLLFRSRKGWRSFWREPEKVVKVILLALQIDGSCFKTPYVVHKAEDATIDEYGSSGNVPTDRSRITDWIVGMGAKYTTMDAPGASVMQRSTTCIEDIPESDRADAILRTVTMAIVGETQVKREQVA
jgi:hypothetical protein